MSTSTPRTGSARLHSNILVALCQNYTRNNLIKMVKYYIVRKGSDVKAKYVKGIRNAVDYIVTYYKPNNKKNNKALVLRYLLGYVGLYTTIYSRPPILPTDAICSFGNLILGFARRFLLSPFVFSLFYLLKA